MYKRYKHLVIEDPDDPPTDEEIREIEWKLGAKLPYDFLDFLDVANGGTMDDYFVVVPLSPNPEAIDFGDLFTTKHSIYGNFLSELEFHTNPDYFNIPEKVLPIAGGASDCYLYLDLRVENAPVVVAYIHGLPEWTGLHQQDTIIKVADSFDDYLAALKFDKAYNKEILEKAIADNNTEAILAHIDYLELALLNWREELGTEYDDGRPKQLKL